MKYVGLIACCGRLRDTPLITHCLYALEEEEELNLGVTVYGLV
jgi:hypothetical protein